MKDKDTELIYEVWQKRAEEAGEKFKGPMFAPDEDEIQEPWKSWADELPVPANQDHSELTNPDLDINYKRISKIAIYLIAKSNDLYHREGFLKAFADIIGPAAYEVVQITDQ